MENNSDENPESPVLSYSELPDNADVTMVVRGGRRYVQWRGGPSLYYAPRWVWRLVAEAEKREN